MTVFDDIIAWLTDQVNKIWTSVGNLYSEISQAVRDVNAYVISQVSASSTAIKTWATPLWDAVYAYISTVWGIINTTIGTAITNIKTWVLGETAKEASKVPTLIEAAKASIETWVNGLIATVTGNIGKERSKIETWVEGLIAIVTASYKWLIDAKTSLVNIIGLLQGDIFKYLADILSRGYFYLKQLFDDPGLFLYAILEPKFMLFGSYLVGYALGSTKYTLPPKPDLSTKTGGTTDWGGGSGMSKTLGKPLQGHPATVSGYVFSGSHPGIDLAIFGGETIYAMHSGKIGEAGWSPYGYGINVTIYGSPYWTRYAHLQSLNVVSGQWVNQGDPIGKGDTTGNSTGNHLHLEIKIGGVFVDPLPYV